MVSMINSKTQLAHVARLPDPDLMTATTLSDDPLAGIYYSAATVLRLLSEQLQRHVDLCEGVSCDLSNARDGDAMSVGAMACRDAIRASV